MFRSTLRSDAFLFVALPIYFADRLSKRWALAHCSPGEPDLEGYGLGFRLRMSSGGFGFFPEITEVKIFVMIVLSLVFYAGVQALRSRKSRFAVPVAIVLGGTLGNLSDFLFVGRVVDFIQLGLGGGLAVTFNGADIAAGIGVLAFDLQWLSARRSGSIVRGDGSSRREKKARVLSGKT